MLLILFYLFVMFYLFVFWPFDILCFGTFVKCNMCSPENKSLVHLKIELKSELVQSLPWSACGIKWLFQLVNVLHSSSFSTAAKGMFTEVTLNKVHSIMGYYFLYIYTPLSHNDNIQNIKCIFSLSLFWSLRPWIHKTSRGVLLHLAMGH